MPRRKLIRQNQFPYHVITRTRNRSCFDIPILEVWSIIKESLMYALDKNKVEIHCFVLMNNHYHFLITTPNSDIDKFMMHFNRQLSRLITNKSQTINQKFSNRYGWSIINNKSYLFNVYRYIYQNPVRERVVNDCYSYPYSSLRLSSRESKFLNHQPHFQYSEKKHGFEKSMGSNFNHTIRLSLKKESFSPGNKTLRKDMITLEQSLSNVL